MQLLDHGMHLPALLLGRLRALPVPPGAVALAPSARRLCRHACGRSANRAPPAAGTRARRGSARRSAVRARDRRAGCRCAAAPVPVSHGAWGWRETSPPPSPGARVPEGKIFPPPCGQREEVVRLEPALRQPSDRPHRSARQRAGLWGCGQRTRVAHIPTGPTATVLRQVDSNVRKLAPMSPHTGLDVPRAIECSCGSRSRANVNRAGRNAATSTCCKRC
jgi:hypothetical protein